SSWHVGKRRKPIVAAFSPAILDVHVTALDEAGLGKSAAECVHDPRIRAGRCWDQQPDDRRAVLLRTCGEWPCRRAAKQLDERAAPHSITSSARASNVGGTSRSSALAVIRLTMRSNLVGCSIGISAGFAPRRILST